ncbi:hypothetical protein FOA52_009965 [Chlamydomonas sp. UWO 241]|nr:hypothetical protein FOA52_009965 [Chlamydomonas sp. UWO 241]
MGLVGPGFTRPMCDLLAKNLNDLFLSGARMASPFACVLASQLGTSGSYLINGIAFDAVSGDAFMANFAGSPYITAIARIHNLTCGDTFEAANTCAGTAFVYDSRNVLAATCGPPPPLPPPPPVPPPPPPPRPPRPPHPSPPVPPPPARPPTPPAPPSPPPLGTLELVVALPAGSDAKSPLDCDVLAGALQGYFILGDWERFQVGDVPSCRLAGTTAVLQVLLVDIAKAQEMVNIVSKSIDYFILQASLGDLHCGSELYLNPAPTNGVPAAFSCGPPSTGGLYTQSDSLCCAR